MTCCVQSLLVMVSEWWHTVPNLFLSQWVSDDTLCPISSCGIEWVVVRCVRSHPVPLYQCISIVPQSVTVYVNYVSRVNAICPFTFCEVYVAFVYILLNGNNCDVVSRVHCHILIVCVYCFCNAVLAIHVRHVPVTDHLLSWWHAVPNRYLPR